MNSIAQIGHNNPPLLLQTQELVDSIYEEAKQWLDGDIAKTQDEVDALAVLLDELRKAAKSADENRKIEKKPFDDGGKQVQANYKPLLEKLTLAQSKCKEAMKPYLLMQEEIKARNEEAARRDAEIAEREALEAAQSLTSLENAQDAQWAIDNAKTAEETVTQIQKQKVHAKGGARAVGLRTKHVVEVVDLTAAARFFWKTHKAEFEALVYQIAEKEVRGGVREIDGCKITEEKVL